MSEMHICVLREALVCLSVSLSHEYFAQRFIFARMCIRTCVLKSYESAHTTYAYIT